MTDNHPYRASDELTQIIESAERLGVEISEAEALQSGTCLCMERLVCSQPHSMRRLPSSSIA